MIPREALELVWPFRDVMIVSTGWCSTPHWPVTAGAIPSGRGHNIWQRAVLREGGWDRSVSGQPSLQLGNVCALLKGLLHSTPPHPLLQFPNYCPVLKAHIHHCLTMKSLWPCILSFHTWDTATIPTRHFQVPLPLPLSSEVTKLKTYTWYYFSKFQWM